MKNKKNKTHTDYRNNANNNASNNITEHSNKVTEKVTSNNNCSNNINKNHNNDTFHLNKNYNTYNNDTFRFTNSKNSLLNRFDSDISSFQKLKPYFLLALFFVISFKIINSPRTFFAGFCSFIKFFSPLLIGIFIALLINPILRYFENKLKLKRWISLIISYVIVCVCVFLIFKLIIPLAIRTMNELIVELPNYISQISKKLSKIASQEQFLKVTLPNIEGNINKNLTSIVKKLTNISTDSFEYLFGVASVLFNIIIGLIMSVYMLSDKEKISIYLKRFLYAIFSKKHTDSMIEFGKISNDIFYQFITGTLIEALIVGVIMFLGFEFIFKLDNSLFFAFIAFVTNMIPYFGPFIGAFFPVTITLVYSPMKAIWLSLFIFVVQQLDGNVIGPKVIGNQVGLTPLCIINAVLIGGGLFGVIGLFLSIPIASIFNVWLNNFIDSRLNR
ncbi:MAG: AI-2E family transporter [Clostridioides sp.]|jgi:predicted PurR-regulated permease PerM|nr:AI-2E family transporter [Clostridioides sp.]